MPAEWRVHFKPPESGTNPLHHRVAFRVSMEVHHDAQVDRRDTASQHMQPATRSAKSWATRQEPEITGHISDGRSVDAAEHPTCVRADCFHSTAVCARRRNGSRSCTGIARKVEVLDEPAGCHFNDLAIATIWAIWDIDSAAERDLAIGTCVDRPRLAVPVVLRTLCR
jgi:hypothetical protein